MSVAGIDVGHSSCVAIARKRGIDVLLNKESHRETPAVISFGEKMRFLGTDGQAKMGLSPQNTVNQLKLLLGRKFKEVTPDELGKLPFKVSEGPDGGVAVEVLFMNEQHSFTPEQLMAMVLVDLKKIVQAETGVPPIDCVLTVPSFYTERQRYAMNNAAQIAGLNCLRLMHENTATALAYGIFKTDLPETEPVHVAFVDMGFSATQVSVVSLKKGGLQVRSHAWDASLGGRNFDELLFNHFVAEFKQKHKIDISTNKKASFKLRSALEKVKKILSANPEAPFSVECIMEDTDVRGSMTRELFEQLAEPLCARFKTALEQGLAESGLSADALSSVEVVGSSMRVPMLARIVEAVFGKPPSRTLNAKEVVARGAALQAAMLSPVFKVRDFDVVDACPYPIDFHWEKDGKPVSQRLFDKNSSSPATKLLTFLRAEPFTITAVNAGTGEKIGEYKIGPFSVPPGAEVAKLKVKVRMNLHGLVSVEQVQAIEEEADPTAGAAGDAPMQDASSTATDAATPAGEAASANGDAAAGPAPMDTDASKADAAAAGEAGKKAAAAKKVKKVDVPFTGQGVAGYTQQQLNNYIEQEGQMAANDKLQEETADRKNAVEAYVYKLRNGLYGPLEAYVKPDEKDAILAKLQACEDWLYEEGEDCTKSVYVAKLEELQTLGQPVEQRAAEEESRPKAAAALRNTAHGYLSWSVSTEGRYAHISPEERQPVAAEAQAALNWLDEKEKLQAGLAKWDTPVLVAADCQKKVDTLERLAQPIVNKPLPKPASPPKSAATPTPEANAAPGGDDGPAPMESEGGEASEGPTPAADSGEPMQS